MGDRLRKVSQWTVLKNLLKFVKNPIPIIDETFTEFGSDTYRVNLGGVTKSIMTKDPGLIQYVLQKQNRNFKKSKLQTEYLAQFIGKGLLTANGDYWLRQRRLIQPGFHKDSLDSFTKIMSTEVEAYSNNLVARIQSGEDEIIMLDEMSYLTLRIVSKALFSTSINDEEIQQFGKQVDVLQEAVIQRIRQPILGWWRKWSGQDRRNKNTAQELYDLVTGIINERRQSKTKKGDILNMLLSARYEDTDEPMSEQQLLDECLVLFAAGYETTANALTWTFYLLDQHRDILDKVLLETDNHSFDAHDPITSLRELDYIRQVVSESLRLYPPAWIIDRIAIEEVDYEGIKIGTNEILNSYIYGVHRDPKHWKDPEIFKPERFAKNRLKDIKPYTYCPFGGGPRLCIGQQFALMELQLVVYTLLKNFDFTINEPLPLVVAPSITLRAESGIHMKVKRRKNES